MEPITKQLFGGVEEKLSHLSAREAAVFCAGCTESLLSNYAEFTRETGWGDPVALRTLLDDCWAILADSSSMDNLKSLLQEQLDACKKIIPHTENFRTPLVSAALDAAASVCETAECLIKNDPNRARNVSTAAIDTVDLHLRGETILTGLEGEDEWNYLYSHPLMIKEAERQEKILQMLRNAPITRYLEEIRRFCWNSGVSNIGYTWIGQTMH